jgi:cytoskeletal protein RodZ
MKEHVPVRPAEKSALFSLFVGVVALVLAGLFAWNTSQKGDTKSAEEVVPAAVGQEVSPAEATPADTALEQPAAASSELQTPQGTVMLVEEPIPLIDARKAQLQQVVEAARIYGGDNAPSRQRESARRRTSESGISEFPPLPRAEQVPVSEAAELGPLP